MRRRALIACVGAAGLARVTPAAAQRAGAPAIGLLIVSPEQNSRAEIDAFAAELASRGWTAPRAPRLTVASADDDAARLPTLARLLVAAAPDALVAQLAESGAALAAATARIPIVMATGSDYVALGLTASLARPSRNVTGFANFNDVLDGKRLELLLLAAPAAKRIGFIWNPTTPRGRQSRGAIEAAAAIRGVDTVALPVSSDAEMATVFDRARAAGVEALMPISDPVVGSNIDFITERAAALGIPAIYGYASFGRRHGGLLTYAADPLDNWRGAAGYVDRLLRGAKVADLPFQEPSRIAFIVNLATARRMGLALPPAILAQADEVIE